MVCRQKLLWIALIFQLCILLPAVTAVAQPNDGKAGAPAEAANADSSVKQEPAAHKSYLKWMIESSGPIGMILFFLSFLTVALTVQLLMQLRRKSVMPPELIADFGNCIKDKRYQDAYQVARMDDSFLGKVLAAGMGKLSNGYTQAVEAMQEVGDDENMRIEHRLSWLAIIGTAAPLLGLIGTVEGIIGSFRVIATSGDTQPKPSLLAEGISTSLFNTFEGLGVAVVAMVAFMLLKNQAARLVLEVGMISGNLMSKFAPRDKVTKPAAD